MTAVLREDFVNEAICMPDPEGKEAAKNWVEAHSCRAWRNGWLFVDGTLIPLFDRPHWYGESYFDRKCNYSMNIQVRSDVRSQSDQLLTNYRLSADCLTSKSAHSGFLVWIHG